MLGSIVWDWNPNLFEGIVTVRWYGLMFAIGFTVGYFIVAKMFKHEGAPESWLGTLLLWVVGGTIIGARLGHVFFYEWDKYSQNPIEILYVWEGGLASHGGTIGVILAVILFSIITTKRSPLWTFDRLVIPIALVGALIRLGNLFNSEIYGGPTDLPWGFQFVRSYQWVTQFAPAAVHPTQIYEALCYLALFGLLMWMYWKRNDEERPGLILGVFFTVLFGCRFLIEFIKNSQEPWEDDMMLNMGQWLSIPFILAGIFFIIRAMMRPRLHLKFPNKFPPEPRK
ncbi:MAG: prolipoprotein diacylglyceryl transferase [Muribaculaceae bacterium]|nr:prolipoprotein diacylglyceryl transferase [Muribaculaceae bacterium]